jgi:hypothetical protein
MSVRQLASFPRQAVFLTSMCTAMADTLICAMGLLPQFKAQARCGDAKRLGPIGGAPAKKLLCHKLFSIVLCLVGADSINSANAQQTTVTKARHLLPRSGARISEKIPMAPGRVARTRKLAPTLFPTTPLTLMG